MHLGGEWCEDCGTVFELSYSPGSGWTETVLHSFQNGMTAKYTDGFQPIGGLIMDADGNLYGTTWLGGSGLGGTVYELSPFANGWTFTVLYSFTFDEGLTGCGPVAPLTMDTAGNLYGTTQCDGVFDEGSVFKLTKADNGWVYTSLHDFNDDDDGPYGPMSNVTIDTDGTLYGTATGGGIYNYLCGGGCGVVWMIKP